MTPTVRSTNIAVPKSDRGLRLTGIDKRPVPQLEIFAPADGYGNGPGVVGDLVGDSRYHGGAQKAVYAFSREELDYWSAELGQELTDGWFGENLTTQGIDLEALRINQQVQIGTALLEVSVSRQPCVTFATHMEVPGWVKRFAAHGRCGTYLRVIEPGIITAGDAVELIDTPDHDVDIRTLFAANLGDDVAAARAVAARCLPPMYHERLGQRLTARAGRV